MSWCPVCETWNPEYETHCEVCDSELGDDEDFDHDSYDNPYEESY